MGRRRSASTTVPRQSRPSTGTKQVNREDGSLNGAKSSSRGYLQANPDESLKQLTRASGERGRNL